MELYELKGINLKQLEKDLLRLGISSVLKKYKITSNYIANLKRKK